MFIDQRIKNSSSNVYAIDSPYFLFRDRCRSNNTKWQFARYNIWQVIKRTKTKTEEMRGYFFFSNTVFIVFLRFLVINGIIYICIYIYIKRAFAFRTRRTLCANTLIDCVYEHRTLLLIKEKKKSGGRNARSINSTILQFTRNKKNENLDRSFLPFLHRGCNDGN